MAHPSRDDLVAYAIGAAEPGEERDVESHVPECERCTRELRALAPAVAVLAESVAQMEPPPELRERVMEVVRSEAAEREAAPAGAQRRGGSRIGAFLLRPATGLAALAVAGAGVAGYLVRDEDGGEEQTVAVAPSPGPSGAGSIEGSLGVADDSAVLTVRGMPRLAKGSVYQVWVAEGTTVRPSSSFVPNTDGSATAAVPEALPPGSEVLVSAEPGPGRAAPSTPPLLSATVD